MSIFFIALWLFAALIKAEAASSSLIFKGLLKDMVAIRPTFSIAIRHYQVYKAYGTTLSF